jgi:cysteine desulfurase
MSAPYTYLDHAATTPVRPELLDAMLPYLGGEHFGNPSSAHRAGRQARAGLDQARREIAEALGLEPSGVIFTSGGTEADNLAVIGAALAARSAGRRMLVAVSATEHKAVLAAAHAVAHHGGEERILPVDSRGQPDPGAVDAVLRETPAVMSVMWVNNETGAIQPVTELARRCAARGVTFHTDLVQAVGRVPIDLRRAGVDLATISGHKLGAPKGIGALLMRKGTPLEPLQHGGSQQAGVRPGTENVAGAVALGRAVTLAVRELEQEARRLGRLCSLLRERLAAAIPDIVIASGDGPRAPHIINLMVPGCDGGALLMHLDLAGIAASGGSACQSGATEPSHVLTAMGTPAALAIGAVRFSLGRTTSEEDIARLVAVFPGIVRKVRTLQEAGSRG